MFDQHNRTGVTLMELLLAVALVAIIAAIAAPMVFHDTGRRSNDSMVDSLIVELEYARAMGLMDLAAYAYFETAAGSSQFKCATQTKVLDGNLAFANGTLINFDNLGRPADKTAKTLSLQTPDSTTIGTVVVSPAGLIKRQ